MLRVWYIACTPHTVSYLPDYLLETQREEIGQVLSDCALEAVSQHAKFQVQFSICLSSSAG